jgi:YbgC/YbaW family acyl-CoA thioester hydrolase
MSTISETTLRVRYAETDQMGVVYHSNYIIWLEVGRVELLRFHYEVVRKADGLLLAEGESVHMVVGHDLKRTHLTGKYRDALHAAAEIAQSVGTMRHRDAQP